MRGTCGIIAILALVAVGTAGCQKTSVGPKASDYQKQRAAIIAKKKQGVVPQARPVAEPTQVAEVDRSFGSVEAGYVYDPVGKRDPFRSFVLERLQNVDSETKGPLEQFELSQLAVMGVVWETQEARALIADPSGQGYIVSAGDPIGKNDGEVVAIDDNLVLVRETYVDYVGDQTTKQIEMRVRQSQGG